MCSPRGGKCYLLAEREGFEPPVRFRTSVFKTDALDHSAIFPLPRFTGFFQKSVQNYSFFLIYANFFVILHRKNNFNLINYEKTYSTFRILGPRAALYDRARERGSQNR